MNVRSTWFVVLLFTLLLQLMGCTKDEDNDQDMSFDPKTETGLFDNSFTHNDIEREYLLYVPSSYTKNVAVPLVFSLHGAGGSKESQHELSQFDAIANAENFILITPEATAAVGNLTVWNQESDPNRANDVDFIDNLIIEINRQYNIDTNRIYIAGSSNGAFMALEIACQLSHKIAAVAAVKGYMTPNQISNCKPTLSTAIIQMHGDSDPLVPYENVHPTIEFWNEFNQTDTMPVVTSRPDIDPNNTNTTISYLYTNGNNGVEVEHLEVLGGSHDWFGEPGTSYDIKASEEAWAFFNKFDIYGAR